MLLPENKVVKSRRSSLMAVEVVRGMASGVHYTVHVTGGKDGVSTRHHAIFLKPATAPHASPPLFKPKALLRTLPRGGGAARRRRAPGKWWR